jgi:hypothetical protein
VRLDVPSGAVSRTVRLAQSKPVRVVRALKLAGLGFIVRVL